MGRIKGSKNKTTTNKEINPSIVNPGLKSAPPLPGKNLITDKNNITNNINLRFTTNKPNYPNNIEKKAEREWQQFSKLIKRNIRARLENIALSKHKYPTLPDGFDARMIEGGFLTRGWVAAFIDPEEGPLALPAMPNFFNVNANPTYASVYGFQGFFKSVHCLYKGKELKPIINVDEITKSDIESVICRDNNSIIGNMPKRYIDYIDESTEILTNLKLAMLISSERLKQPYILVVSKKAVGKQASSIINKVHNNDRDVLLIDEKITDEKSIHDYIELIDLKGDNESPKKLAELWENQFNHFLTIFGINTNPTPDKSQYVNTTENNSNNQLLYLEEDIRFQNRQKWCKDLKELLGLDITVELNKGDVNLQRDIKLMKGEINNELGESKSNSESNI